MRTIVITGGAKGIGRCLVEYFASQGDAVYFIDMDADAVATVTEKLCAKQMNVYGFTGDIADEQYCKSLRREYRRNSTRNTLPDKQCLLDERRNPQRM
mgnify:CR=1 FL=1